MRARELLVAGLLMTTVACEYSHICYGLVSDACRRAEDLVPHIGVQIADASSMGSPTPGDAGALGATGLLSLGVRSTYAAREHARLDDVPVRGDGTMANSKFAVATSASGAIAADLVAGAYGGRQFGPIRTGAIDLLMGVSALAGPDGGSLRTTTGSRLGVTIGARLGLVAETRSLPAVSVTAFARTLPRLGVDTDHMTTTRDPRDVVSIELRRLDVRTEGLRLAASKKFGRVGLAFGIGRDNYTIASQYTVTVSDTTLGGGISNTSAGMRRGIVFGGMAIPVGKATLGIEGGRLFGGRAPETFNQFGDRPVNAARNFALIGLRIPAGRTVDRR